MRLTTKGHYAVTAMADLASNQHRGPVSLKKISRARSISLSYLEQLFAKMREHKLVEGIRGPGGGYRLARDVNSITIADIINAVDEHTDITQCKGRMNCQDGQQCQSHNMWAELSNQINLFLTDVKLGQLVQQRGKFHRGAASNSSAQHVLCP